ncbi:MAG: exodeoxyribonuclease VII small subunit [Odoribacter sp.]|nr:exodeoxyribonuclease VII small subunit [Odoribacter sp.]
MEPTYNQALAELEKILGQLRADTCDVDSLVEMTRRAVELLNICRSKLTTTDEQLRQVLSQLQDPQP